VPFQQNIDRPHVVEKKTYDKIDRLVLFRQSLKNALAITKAFIVDYKRPVRRTMIILFFLFAAASTISPAGKIYKYMDAQGLAVERQAIAKLNGHQKTTASRINHQLGLMRLEQGIGLAKKNKNSYLKKLNKWELEAATVPNPERKLILNRINDRQQWFSDQSNKKKQR